MEQAPLKLALELPVQPGEQSLRYSGALGRLDLTRLNPFLAISAGTRLESGIAYEAAFEAEGSTGRVGGVFRGAYEGLELVFLDRATQSEQGVLNRIKSALADSLVVRNRNMPTENGAMKVGRIDYTAKPHGNFFRFLWFGVRSGLLDLLGLSEFVKESR
jgi:hypothetical protein